MKQVLQSRRGLTVVRDVPAPPCPPGSLLVRNAFSVISSGTERSRVVEAQKSLAERARERPDLVKEVAKRAVTEGLASTKKAIERKLAEESPVGYSSSGQVLEVGAQVSGFDPGDRVACAGVGHANHAELVSVPANLCVKVPPGVQLETAALSAIAAIGLHGIRLAEVAVGDRVAIIGCGLVGQIVARLLRCAGAETFASDVDEARLEDARRGGADHVFVSRPGIEREIMAATIGVGVDVAIVAAATSSSEPLLLAAEIARERGTLLIIGDVPVQIPREPLYRKELDLRVSRSYGPGRYDIEYEERGLDYPIGYVRWTEKRNMECVLALQARGTLDLADLIEQVFPVDDTAEAYGRLAGQRVPRPRGALLLSYPEGADASAAVKAVEDGPRTGVRRNRIRVGLLGPGDFARSVIIPALLRVGASLEVVAGGTGPSAAAVQREFEFARVAASEQALIEDVEVDAVVICTRHGSHASLASAALDAGKHVFCEKPLALSVDELEQLLETASTSDGILAVGFNRRFSPLLRELRAFAEHRASPLTAIYRVAAGYLPPANWQHDLAVGGGRIVGEVCHFVDSLAYLTGAEIDEAHAVGIADEGKAIQARDNVIATLTHADGSLGTILYAADAGPGLPKERIEVHSRARSGTLDDFRTLELYHGTRPERRRSRTQQKGHEQEIEAFLAGVRAGEPPVPLREVVNVSVATFAIVESLRTGRPVRVTNPWAALHNFRRNENA